MNDYRSCNEFERAVDYNDIRYYRPEDDRFNSVSKNIEGKNCCILTTLDYWKFKCSFIIFASLRTSDDCDSRSKGADSPAGISVGSVNVKSVPIV